MSSIQCTSVRRHPVATSISAPDFFEGNVVSLRGKNTSLEFQWLADTRGAWNAPDEARQKERKPNWVRERDRVIAGAYLGEIEFDEKAVDHWYSGAKALCRKFLIGWFAFCTPQTEQ